LGRRESQSLEFKGREILQHPADLGREVVAMLNGVGHGDIWVGLGEHEGQAAVVESIDRIDAACQALHDHLVDTIEPTPLPGEVVIERHDIDDGGAIIHLAIRPQSERRPFAQLRGNARHYLLRVGARLRAMTREEIAREFRGQSAEEDLAQQVADVLIQERERQQTKDYHGLWLRLQPVGEVSLDLHAPVMTELLREPTRSGNRPMGWNFIDRYQEPKRRQGRLVLGGGDAPVWTEIHEDGGLLFATPIARLHWKGGANELWPYPLLEFPTSVFRLAATLYSHGSDDTSLHPNLPVVADLALLGLTGWTLRPGSPETTQFLFAEPVTCQEGDHFLLTKPMVFSSQEVIDRPDRCAFRVVRRLYEAFGLSEDAIPHEYDREAGRLLFPS
jgi:hypothetical protein